MSGRFKGRTADELSSRPHNEDNSAPAARAAPALQNHEE
jgi:hypothetical protein